MKNIYILENEAEAKRLDAQSEIEQFSIEDELKKIKFPQNASLLDAGCGSGLACNYLNKIFPHFDINGCDSSNQRLLHASNENPSLHFFKADITKLSSYEKKYDIILNRYVAHHLSKELYQKVLNEFFLTLNDHGKVIIIDADGALLNIGTLNEELSMYLEIIKRKFSGNLHQARFIPQMLKKAGFKNITYEITTMNFQGNNRLKEIAQYEERIEFSKELYSQMLGSEKEFKSFKELYLLELQSSPIFYNKFIIEADK